MPKSHVFHNKSVAQTIRFDGVGIVTDTHQGIFVRDIAHGGHNWIWWFQPSFPKNHKIITQKLHGPLPSPKEQRRLVAAIRKYRWGKTFRHKHHLLGVVDPSFARLRDAKQSTNPWYPFKDAVQWERGVWETYFSTHRNVKFDNPAILAAYQKFGKTARLSVYKVKN